MAEVEDFVKELTIDKLLSYKRDIIFDIPSQYDIELGTWPKKFKIRDLIIRHLVQEDLWDKTFLEYLEEGREAEEIVRREYDFKMRSFEFEKEKFEKQLEIEKLRLAQEAEQREKDRQLEELRLRQQSEEKEIDRQKESDRLFEIEKLRLAQEAEQREKDRQLEELRLRQQFEEKEKDRQLKKAIERDKLSFFDVTKHVRFVPPFTEKEVDKYFLLFEKVAKDLKWPEDKQTILLQSVLTGKARDVYTALNLEQASKS